MTMPIVPQAILGEVSAKASNALASAWKRLEQGDGLVGGVGAAAGELGKGVGSVFSRLQSADPLEAVSLIGLDQAYVKSEVAMLDSIRTYTYI